MSFDSHVSHMWIQCDFAVGVVIHDFFQFTLFANNLRCTELLYSNFGYMYGYRLNIDSMQTVKNIKWLRGSLEGTLCWLLRMFADVKSEWKLDNYLPPADVQVVDIRGRYAKISIKLSLLK